MDNEIEAMDEGIRLFGHLPQALFFINVVCQVRDQWLKIDRLVSTESKNL
jgi:hypothetical protein